MAEWTAEELAAIAGADDLHIAPLRPDGVTFGTPTWIWSVAVDGGLYVRAYHGVQSRWYQAALTQGAGGITAAGIAARVRFESVTGPVNDYIDAAYHAKYATSPYLPAMIATRTRAATIRIRPNSPQSGVGGPVRRPVAGDPEDSSATLDP